MKGKPPAVPSAEGPATAGRRGLPTVNSRTKTRLRRLAAKYETAAFVEGDPIRFLHTTSGPGVETMAFVAACLSYGSRKQFLPKIQTLVDMAGGDVHGWILAGRYARRFRAGDGRSFYRLFSYGKMHELFAGLRALLRRHGGLGAFLRANLGRALSHALAERDTRGLKMLLELGEPGPGVLDKALSEARGLQLTEATAILLEKRREQPAAGRRRSFDL